MEKIGSLKIHYKNFENGIFYYDMDVNINGKSSSMVIPRYDQALGWVEAFGLPFQHDWVVLSEFGKLEKQAMLTLNGRKIPERLLLESTNTEHSIKLSRENETFLWTQDFSQQPFITRGVFESPERKYSYEGKTRVFDGKRIEKIEEPYIQKIRREMGIPDVVIEKTFNGRGNTPEIFYEMFPIDQDLSEIEGSIIECGYLRKTGTELEKAHGDWRKLLRVNEIEYAIEETCGDFINVEIEGKPMEIKDRYSKTLYKLN